MSLPPCLFPGCDSPASAANYIYCIDHPRGGREVEAEGDAWDGDYTPRKREPLECHLCHKPLSLRHHCDCIDRDALLQQLYTELAKELILVEQTSHNTRIKHGHIADGLRIAIEAVKEISW